MKVTFWLLDISYEANDTSSEIWLWGITENGDRILIIDRKFAPYFFAVVADNADVVKVGGEISRSSCVLAAKPEPVERKLFGKPVKAIKVSCNTAEEMTRCAKQLRNLEDVKDHFEDDIRASMRYLIDNDVVPCSWHEVEATEETAKPNLSVAKVYLAQSKPRHIGKVETPLLRIMGLSTIYYSREGTPKPDRNPILIISTATNNGGHKQFLSGEDMNDKPVLKAFIQYVLTQDPDLIVGYGVNSQDWQYLKSRCKRNGLQLNIDRANTEPHTSVYGHFSLNGRVNLDIADFTEQFPDVKVQTLGNLAEYLNIIKPENRATIEDIEIPDYWDDHTRRQQLKQFSMDNTEYIMRIFQAIMDFAMQLSSLVSMPLDYVGTAAAGFRVESFLMKRTHKLGELVPKRVEQPYRPYAGGLVLRPKPGLHENIAVLDFKSMYPNIMITYNLSPDTYLPPGQPEPKNGVFTAPEVKHRFLKQPPGFYKEILQYLITVRNQIRTKMTSFDRHSLEFRILDARQKAVKVIANAAYGYAGWTGARWYMKPVAEAAAAWGRDTIQKAIEMAENDGLKVVYGDTDSLFIENQPQKIEKLSEQIQKNLSLEVQPDKIYERIFFTEAKKRYAGLLLDGTLDVVGMEVVRGDWAGIAKNVQEKVLEIILKQKSPERAVEFVHDFVCDVQQKRVPYRDFVIWKTLSKPAEEYENKAAHVEAAQLLKAKGWELGAGDKIGYVITLGKGRLYERSKPYVLANYDEVDLNYYVLKQIVPAAARILESFGITEEQLLKSQPGTKEAKLTDFLKG